MALQPLKGPPDPVNITNFSSLTSYLRNLRGVIMAMWTGKLQCVAELTLTANQATTTFTDNRLSKYSAVDFDPLTANAATEKAAGTLYVLLANRGAGSWTVTHANAASADRSYRVTILG